MSEASPLDANARSTGALDDSAFVAVAPAEGLLEAHRVDPPPPPPPPPEDLADVAAEVVRLTNLERSKAGLAPLTVHGNLVVAATTHAMDQREQPCKVGYLTHTGSDGSNAADRILRTGLSIHRWAENIACAFRSAESVVKGWMGSDGHRVNILNPKLTHIGVAVTESSTGRRYWVQVFSTLR